MIGQNSRMAAVIRGDAAREIRAEHKRAAKDGARVALPHNEGALTGYLAGLRVAEQIARTV